MQMTLATAFLFAWMSAQSTVSTGMPRHLAHTEGKGWYVYDATANTGASIAIGMPQKQVVFSWKHTRDGEKSAAAIRIQRIALPYYPTDFIYRAGHLFVAGKLPRGGTVIEKWTLGVPQVIEGIEPRTFETKLQILPPDIAGVEELYRESAVGRDGVRAMFLDAGTAQPTGLFVYFDDSRDVYRLDIATGTYRLEFSSTGPASVPVEPHLAHRGFDNFWAAKHRTHGAVYVFGVWMSTTTACVVLRDVDCDGELDDSLVIGDYETWVSLGLDASSDDWVLPE